MDLLTAAVEWTSWSCPPDKVYVLVDTVLYEECEDEWLREAWKA